MRKLVIAVTLLICTCGAPSPDSGPGRITVPECDDTGSCILAIEIDGDLWAMNCNAVRPESVSQDVVAVGGGGVFVDEARPIVGIDPDAVLAAHVTGEECGGVGDGGQWVMARLASGNDEHHATSAARAICDHGVTPTEYDLCEEGGRIQWSGGEGTDAYSTKHSYFPEYQEEVESALGKGDPELAWRTDPTEVATRLWLRDNASLCLDEFAMDFYPRCRVGVAPAVIEDGAAEVAFYLQWASPVNLPEELAYETYQQRLTLENTGEAWWVIGFVEEPSTQHGTEDVGRQASDAMWAECCQIVLIDNENGVAPPVTSG